MLPKREVLFNQFKSEKKGTPTDPLTREELFIFYTLLEKFLAISPLKEDKKIIKKILFKVDKLIWK